MAVSKDAELKQLFLELVREAENLLQDPEIQDAIPSRYRVFIKIALKIIRLIAELVQ